MCTCVCTPGCACDAHLGVHVGMHRLPPQGREPSVGGWLGTQEGSREHESVWRCVNGLRQQGYVGLMVSKMNTDALYSLCPEAPAPPYADIHLDCLQPCCTSFARCVLVGEMASTECLSF